MRLESSKEDAFKNFRDVVEVGYRAVTGGRVWI